MKNEYMRNDKSESMRLKNQHNQNYMAKLDRMFAK
jgi:hypothetical protein